MRPNYYDIKKLSNSSLKYFLDYPPKKAFYLWNEPTKETPALIFGRAYHCLILEPETFDDQFGVLDPAVNLRTKEGRAEKEKLLESGKTILKYDDYQTMLEMKDALYSCDNIKKMLSGIKCETEYFKKMLGEEIKGKLDAEKPNAIIDLKTTLDASPQAFMRECINRHYFMQGWLYCQLADKKNFAFIAQEKTPPYSAAIYVMTEEQLQIGHALFDEAITAYKFAKENQKDDYSKEIARMDTPEWYVKKWLSYEDGK
jgi:exodeoxyribonuclease VIII